MRRRRLFTLASAVSLVLCVATCVLWVRSHRRPVAVSYLCAPGSAGQPQWYVATGAGTLYVQRVVYTGRDAYRPPGFGGDSDFLLWYTIGRTTPFAYFGREVYVEDAGEWSAPLWACSLAAGLLPAAWAIGRIRRRSFRVGLCPTCGYNLRATPEAGGALLERCPECGAGANTIAASS